MPTVRYQIRNEYGLADPEVYRAVDKDDPEALLEGVAMAGLVGVLRQLGDLSEFAAEVFHNLHEEVMATSARGHGLMLRVLQLEAEFPSIEKAILSETDHSHCAYSAGIDWHASLRVEQNLVSQGDMPRFILDSYEECRGPPRLFMLDKFDVAGAGACLTRYSNPSFFKTASAFSEMMEEAQREKRARKPKKKGSNWRSGETTESFFTPIIDYLQFAASESVRGKFPARIVKLKHRKFRLTDISNRKSYMEDFLKEESFVQNDSKSSLRDCSNNKILDGAPEVQEVLMGAVSDPLLVKKESSPPSLKEVTGKALNQKRENGELLETVSISSCVSQEFYPNSQSAKETMLMGLGNEMDIHAFDINSDEIDTNPSLLQLAVQNNIFAVSGFITDDEHDSYRSDDIGSELENYVDALNTMESEIETDSDSRAKPDPILFKRESQGTNPNVSGQFELEPRSLTSGIVRSFDASVTSEKVKDGKPRLSQSTIPVDLPDQQLKVRTVLEETSNLEFNDVETGKLERMREDMTLVTSACLTSNEPCDEKQPNAAMVVPLSGEAFSSYCITDSDLKSQPNLQEAQSHIAHPDEAISGRTQNSSEIDEHIESSFLPWQTNHIVVSPTFEERTDIPTDVLEEMNPIEYGEDGIPLNVSDKGYMSCAFSETENGILPEKAPSDCSKDLSTLLDDGIGKPLAVPEPDKNDYICGSSLQSVPVGSTVLESQDSSIDMEIGVQSIDLPMKVSPNFMVDEVKESKQLNSSVLFPAEAHKLPLVESKDSGSPRSSQTSENVNDIIAFISDEGGSPLGSQNNSVIGQLAGSTEEKMFNDLANTLEMMPRATQTQAESSLVEVPSICVQDSLHDSVENDNEAYSVEILSPKSYATEIGKISATHEEFEHPQLSSSSRNIDILGCDDLISYELEHFPDVDELQESSNDVMLKPLPSSCREDPGANQLHREVTELIETNGEESVHDGLEFANDSSKLGVQHDLLLLGESKNNSFTGNGIPKDNINDQVVNIVESAKVTTFDVLLQEDPLLENDTPHQNYPDIEEPALTRDSTSLDSENKSYLLFTENQEIEMFFNSVSKSQSSAQHFSNSLDAKLADVKEDKLQDSDSKSEDFITEDDTAGDILSLLQPSNVHNFDEQFQEDLVSEDPDLNLLKPVLEELNGAKSDSKVNIVTLEDASLNQHKLEIQEAAIENDLTSSKLPAPLCENGDQKAASIVSSSQLQAAVLSNFTNAKFANYNFDATYMEESLISSREDEQHSESDASMQHFQVDAERTEVPSEKSSVSQAVDEPTIAPLYRLLENIEPSYIHSHEVSSDEPTVSYMASEALSSRSPVADSIPIPTIGAEETLKAFPGETISSFPIQEGIEETPPLPPLPPMQWRMGSNMHINPFPASKEKMNQHAGTSASPFALVESYQHASSCTDGQPTESLKLSEFPATTSDQRQQFEIYSSGLSLLASSKEEDKIMDEDSPFTVAPSPSLKDVIPQHPGLLEAGNPQALKERRPKLVKLLPGLEFERSQEAPIKDRDAIPPLGSFMFMPTAGDGMYQYGYGDYGGYDGDSLHYHNLSAPFPVAVHAYHMFLREGNSSAIYDIMLQDMEGDNPNEKLHSILSRPRDPLIEAVAAHDKSTLRKVSELDRPLRKPNEDENNHLLEQIKTKSLNLKPATSKVNVAKAPSTNLKVAAMLEKANAIRQACVGSDEDDDDDNWNDS